MAFGEEGLRIVGLVLDSPLAREAGLLFRVALPFSYNFETLFVGYNAISS